MEICLVRDGCGQVPAEAEGVCRVSRLGLAYVKRHGSAGYAGWTANLAACWVDEGRPLPFSCRACGVPAGIWRHGVRVWQAVQERFRQPFSGAFSVLAKSRQEPDSQAETGRQRQAGRARQADAGLAPVPDIV